MMTHEADAAQAPGSQGAPGAAERRRLTRALRSGDRSQIDAHPPGSIQTRLEQRNTAMPVEPPPR